MLNPPLSLLSDDLLSYIVDHVAKLRFPSSNLYNLSITDRAFTRFCQTYFFKDLRLGYRSATNSIISKKLAKIKTILNDEPSIANRVRAVHLCVTDRRNKWLFDDPDFITVIELLAKSLIPPHKLYLTGDLYSFIIESPILVVRRLKQTFFSQTLTVLYLTDCMNVPLTLFLVCPNLREVYLDGVGVFESGDHEYPDEQCSGRELPALEILSFRQSESLVKQMITPPPEFSFGVVVWLKLRVLKLCPRAKEEMLFLRPILNVACNTLEELHLTELGAIMGIGEQHSLAGIVDLSHLPNLHVFAISAHIGFDAQEPMVLRDINLVLSTIPKDNLVTKLSLDFTINGEYLFDKCLEEDWVEMCDEVVRISAGKAFKFNLKMSIGPSQSSPPGRADLKLLKDIKEKVASLSNYSNICTEVWPSPF